MRVPAVLVLAAAGLCAALPVLPAFKGVLVTGQYRCDDFLCPDWELDVARVDPAFREHLITKLAMLVPKSPIADMSFPVYTAYHDPTRTFYTIGWPQADAGTVWGVAVDSAVNTSTILFTTRVQMPAGASTFRRLHVSRNNTVMGMFDDGALFALDVTTGAWSTFGTTVPGNFSAPKVEPASILDTSSDNLYTFFLDSGTPYLSTLNIDSGKLTVVEINLKGMKVRWDVESVFQALWVSSLNAVVLLWAGDDTGFDQIVSVNPTTGDSKYINDNLAESQLFFMCDENTKSCDLWQTAAYDAIENRIYFQATNILSDDDIGTTVLMYVDLNGRDPYIDTGLNPFTFGYLGFSFVPVLSP